MEVKFLRLPHAEGLPLPSYQTEHAAGLDVVCALPLDAPHLLHPGERALIPTGFAMELPIGWEAQIRPRSGLALKQGVTVLNAPGTVDADYRGEIGVLLINFGDTPFLVVRSARIAQLVVNPVATVASMECRELSGTSRASGGFGSTGLTSRADHGERK